MSATEYADLWAAPDAKRERAPGKWDLYCAECGRFAETVYWAVEPPSVRCGACRARERVKREDVRPLLRLLLDPSSYRPPDS